MSLISSPTSSYRWLCHAVPSAQLLALTLLVGGCGRIGFDTALGSREPVYGDPTRPGVEPTLDGGDANRDASPGIPAGDGGLVDAEVASADAFVAQVDGAVGPPACAPCGLGQSCLAGRCVEECAGRYAGSVDCQSFENGLVDLTVNAGVTAETGVVHSGAGSLRTESSGASVTSRLVIPLSPALTSGALHFRGYYFIETPPTDGLIKLAGFRSNAESNVDLNVNPDRSLDLYFHELGGARVASASGSAVFGAWMCLQAVLEISDANGKVTVSVDGREVLASPSDRDTLTVIGINRVEAGIGWSETSGRTVVYVDDVVLDTAPVPCQ